LYQINHQTKKNYLEIENSNKTAYAKIHLNDGASLKELILDGKCIIKDLEPLKYQSTYASSILFPFANRIKDGHYTFEGKSFDFEINEKAANNALHGLVYNKTFEVLEQTSGKNEASVKLSYTENHLSHGFPYTYIVQLEYRLTNDALSLKMDVENTSDKAFPFTLGWHPYFYSSNLYNSSISFQSDKKIIIGERNIGTGVEPIKPVKGFYMENKKLDDCWVLNGTKIQFTTPDYDLLMSSSGKNNYLQIYTPPKENTIAIEPTTGVSDSFNNKIGLEILNAGATYSIEWNLKLNIR